MNATMDAIKGIPQTVCDSALASSAVLQASEWLAVTQVASCGELQLNLGATQPPSSWMPASMAALSSGKSGRCSMHEGVAYEPRGSQNRGRPFCGCVHHHLQKTGRLVASCQHIEIQHRYAPCGHHPHFQAAPLPPNPCSQRPMDLVPLSLAAVTLRILR